MSARHQSTLLLLGAILISSFLEASGECNELEDLVNKERRGSGLRPLHCDPHMRWTANRHLDDAIEGAKKNLAWPEERGCNAHSWLVKFPCCYTGDHENPDCMWDKPLVRCILSKIS